MPYIRRTFTVPRFTTSSKLFVIETYVSGDGLQSIIALVCIIEGNKLTFAVWRRPSSAKLLGGGGASAPPAPPLPTGLQPLLPLPLIGLIIIISRAVYGPDVIHKFVRKIRTLPFSRVQHVQSMFVRVESLLPPNGENKTSEYVISLSKDYDSSSVSFLKSKFERFAVKSSPFCSHWSRV